jgi:hypothetical protein
MFRFSYGKSPGTGQFFFKDHAGTHPDTDSAARKTGVLSFLSLETVTSSCK